MKNKAFTLVEIMVVVVIFSFIFGATLSIIHYSNQSWRIGRMKLETQQEARKAMDFIALELRESSPIWHVGETDYSIEINQSGDAIRFYVPLVNNSGEITGLEEIRIYCGGRDNKQLLKIVGQGQAVALTDASINNIAAEKPFFQFLNASRTEISLRIPIIINQDTPNEDTFVLSSRISLRNIEAAFNGVVVEEVSGTEGEF